MISLPTHIALYELHNILNRIDLYFKTGSLTEGGQAGFLWWGGGGGGEL